MSISLNTHAYDAKWKERLIYVFYADDAYFEYTDAIEMSDEEFTYIIERSSCAPNTITCAQNWRKQVLENNAANQDGANDVNALEIMRRLERIIQHRLDIEKRIPEMIVEEIDSTCAIYAIPRTGTCLDFDEPDDNKHPMVVDNSDLNEIVQSSNDSIINSYIEQLAEIQNGACPQGRTTRLFQIYTSFY